MTWSTASPGTPALSSAAFAAKTPRSVALYPFRLPPNVPNGVRRAERKTMSVEWPCVAICSSSPGGGCVVRPGAERLRSPLPHRLAQPVADRARAQRAAEVRRGPPFLDRAADRSLDPGRLTGVAQVVEHERRGQDRGERVRPVLTRQVGRRAVDRLEEAGAAGVQVRGRREAEPAGERGREVAQDVAEEVRCDDDPVAARPEDEVEGQRVHEERLALDVRVLGADLGENAAPQVADVPHRVRLVREGDAPAARRMRELERGTDDPLDALPRVHILLDRDLVGRPPLERAAEPDVEAFGVLAEDVQVEVRGADVLERREGWVVETDRAEVDVEVQPEPEPEQDLAGVRVVRDPRVTERAEQDRVVACRELG